MHVYTIETRRYMPRKPLPDRRKTWRQKVRIVEDDGNEHHFYVDFGEYPNGRLAELFINAKKFGTFVRGVLDTLARSVSLAMQSGTSPSDAAKMMLGHEYPPCGRVVAEGSTVKTCKSIADYIGQEIMSCYDEDGKRKLIQSTTTPIQVGGGRAVGGTDGN